ncbi:hypothetical protein B0H17DRAFT_1217364 [Mycena rosella]|uniref:Uncharacterized protein n=1 Tax=Mycena rosella TaxID=1033263 RepID=A0AAD7FN84_MYCRO|nr:hypothetical protein B0H17DRAFT_1217364 [Mycena rosella]
MSEEITERMWGIFDETGIFLALCHHGFVLLIADMVKSGELAKYGLAIANSLLDAFSPDFGFGYNIGCGFEEIIKNSPLGPKAKQLNFKMLVDSFYGHAHNQMCQLWYLATYVLGVLLQVQRSGSDCSICQHLSLQKSGGGGQVSEEKVYLWSLSKELEEETQQIEYYQALVNLQACKKTFDDIFAEGSTANGTAKRHARENYDKAYAAVQAMEQTLEIAIQRYRCCVNKLEELVLKRLFELTKMNISQTDFDILHDPTSNADLQEWATPIARQLMDSFFWLEHVKEEIPCLNIEIRQLVTYIRNEKALLLQKEVEVRVTDPNLAYFIGKYCSRQGHADKNCMVHLWVMAKKLGSRFTGTLATGIR